MRKLLIKLTAGLLMSPVILSGGAAYATSCNITNTGPDSQNDCSSVQSCTSTTDNNTMVKGDNDSSQSANSGDANNADNTSSGGSTSGTSSNSSSSTTNVDIDNDSSNACQPATAATGGKGGGSTSTTTSQPAGGKGGGAVAQPQVQAPVGGVGAGEGGTARPYASLAVLVGSLLAGGLGFRLLRQIQEG